MNNADKAGPKIKISGRDNLVYRKGNQEVYVFSEAPETSRLPATGLMKIPTGGVEKRMPEPLKPDAPCGDKGCIPEGSAPGGFDDKESPRKTAAAVDGNEDPGENVSTEAGRPTGGTGDFNRVNYWKEESTGAGDPRLELLLREIVGLLQAIEQRLDRLEKYMTRPWKG